MNREEILSKLKPIIADQLSVNESAITEDKKLSGKENDCLGADSMDAASTIMEIEEEFDIAIPDSDMEKLITVKDIVDYIEAHTKNN